MEALVFNVALFGFGLLLLVKGADWLVDSSARLAKQFGISEFTIGLTIVALGTSIPELAAAVTASFYGNSALAVGDIIGSNIANIALVLGIAGVFTVISVKKEIYNRDGFVMLSATLLFYFFCLNGILSRVEGALFLILFSAYMLYFIATKKPFKRQFQFKQYLEEYADLKGRERFEKAPSLLESVQYGISKEILNKAFFTVRRVFTNIGEVLTQEVKATRFFFKQLFFAALGIVCIFFGANFLVEAASLFPMDQAVVGLVFVAIGTSLPEVAVTISSLRKGLPAIMIGNLIGSNIANILWVGGAAALVGSLKIPAVALSTHFVFLLLVTWLFLVFLRNDYRITRIESFTLLFLYLLLLGFTFATGFGV